MSSREVAFHYKCPMLVIPPPRLDRDSACDLGSTGLPGFYLQLAAESAGAVTHHVKAEPFLAFLPDHETFSVILNTDADVRLVVVERDHDVFRAGMFDRICDRFL